MRWDPQTWTDLKSHPRGTSEAIRSTLPKAAAADGL